MSLVLEHVSKRFSTGGEDVVAVDDVSLRVSPGELRCVYGASGSGKTTLIHVMAGIVPADAGTVTVAGRALDPESESDRARVRLDSVAVVFQDDNLLEEFTAVENAALPLLVRGVDRVQAQARAEQALAQVGLGELGGRLPRRLSGGQRQRVGVARALAGGHQVLLADEPTGALDSVNSRRLFGLLRELCDRQGTAVVIATHDPLAREYANAVATMTDGRLETS